MVPSSQDALIETRHDTRSPGRFPSVRRPDIMRATSHLCLAGRCRERCALRPIAKLHPGHEACPVAERSTVGRSPVAALMQQRWAGRSASHQVGIPNGSLPTEVDDKRTLYRLRATRTMNTDLPPRSEEAH